MLRRAVEYESKAGESLFSAEKALEEPFLQKEILAFVCIKWVNVKFRPRETKEILMRVLNRD